MLGRLAGSTATTLLYNSYADPNVSGDAPPFPHNTSALESSSASQSARSIFIPSEIRYWHHINEQCVFAVSIIVNPILAFLVFTEKNATLKSYARVLLQNCFADIIYTLVCIASELQMEFSQGHIIFIIGNRLLTHRSIFWHYFLVFMYTLCCATVINIVPVMFVFRYCLVCRCKQMTGFELIKLTSIPVTFAFGEAISLTYAFYISEPRRKEMCTMLMDNPIWYQPGTNTPITHCLLSNMTNPLLVIFIVLVIIMDSHVYIVSMWCSVRISRAMKVSKFSEKTTQLQRQMNWILVAQICLPLFTAVLPVGVLILFPLLKIDVPGAGVAVTMAMAWIPIISPITTIALVGSFRRKLFNVLMPPFIRRVFNIRVKVTTASAATSAPESSHAKSTISNVMI